MSTTTTTAPLDWPALLEIEPRLAALESEAQATRFSWTQYEIFKGRLNRLVGWDSPHPELADSAAWQIAHRRILDALETGGRQ